MCVGLTTIMQVTQKQIFFIVTCMLALGLSGALNHLLSLIAVTCNQDCTVPEMVTGNRRSLFPSLQLC